jgi:hypothetical protein
MSTVNSVRSSLTHSRRRQPASPTTPTYSRMENRPTLEDMTPEAGEPTTERGILVGKTRYGKSTLQRFLIQTFCKRYNRTGRVLVIDTKPRWRAERVVTGRSPQRRYRDFVKGDTLPAVALDNLKDWNLAWDREQNPQGIVISQRLDLEEEDQRLVRWQVLVIKRFLSTQRPDVPSLLVIDEGMDFFGPSGNALYSNVIQRCWRAGGEKGMSCLIGVQRPKTINLQMLTESNLLYLFHMAYEEDLKRLQEMGFPRNVGAPGPKQKYEFLFLKDGELYPKPLKLTV